MISKFLWTGIIAGISIVTQFLVSQGLRLSKTLTLFLESHVDRWVGEVYP